MNVKNLSRYKKTIFYLDIILFDLFVLSLSPKFTGLQLHEITGILLLIAVLIHVLTEWNWLSNYIGRFFRAATRRDRFNLLLNLLLFGGIIFLIVSGLVISQVILPFFKIRIPREYNWLVWHAQVATVVMFLAGFHLALSARKIIYYFSKRRVTHVRNKTPVPVNTGKVIYRICILVVLSLIIAGLTFCLMGKPSGKNVYNDDAVHEFSPSLFAGTIQLVSQIFFIVITCIIARKWLRVRL